GRGAGVVRFGPGRSGRCQAFARGSPCAAARGPAVRDQDLRLDLQEPRRSADERKDRRPAARGRGLPRPPGGRRPPLREARELRREHRRGDDRRRDHADGGGPAAGARALGRRARARGSVPRRRQRGGALLMRAAAALGARLFPRPGELVRAATDRARGFQLSPRSRRRLALAILLVLALGALYMLWLRDSSFVRVERVHITGVTGRDAGRLRARLRAAALRMTTLHVDEQALMRSLGANSGVRALRVESNFPHALRIAVVQELPVAVLVSGGDRVPVAAQGVLLPAMSGAGVPAIDVGTFPSHGRL